MADTDSEKDEQDDPKDIINLETIPISNPSKIVQQLWKSSILKVIGSSISERLRVLKFKRSHTTDDLTLMTFLEWRLGNNLYCQGLYNEAIAPLENAATGGAFGRSMMSKNIVKEFLHPKTDVHITAARCRKQIYLLTKDRQHLEFAYKHYTNSIDSMNIVTGLIQLPGLLYEFALMLEMYGAFQSAIELYWRIIDNFPYYRGYFDAMYRSALVGVHVCSLMQDDDYKDEILTKCIDSIAFILEAVPMSISEVRNY